MKTFKVNRNSWHYRFQNALEVNPHKRTDFCSYWRGLAFAFLKSIWLIMGLLAMLFAILLAMLFAIGLIFSVVGSIAITIAYPEIAWSIVTELFAVLLGGIIFAGLAYVSYKISGLSLKTKAEDKQPSIIATKYRSWKDKVCYKVEFYD